MIPICACPIGDKSRKTSVNMTYTFSLPNVDFPECSTSIRPLLTGLLFLLLQLDTLQAQQPPAEEPDQTQEIDGPTSRENPISNVPYESGRIGEPTCEDRWSDFLPILGQGRL